MDPLRKTGKAEIPTSFQIGGRVFAAVGTARFAGVIRFVGETNFADGEWVGVELDEAKGKNDGFVKGIRYFDCQANHGLFVRKTALTRVKDEVGNVAKKLVTHKTAAKKIAAVRGIAKAGASAASPAAASSPAAAAPGSPEPSAGEHSPEQKPASPSNATVPKAAAAGSPPAKAGTPVQSASAKQGGAAARGTKGAMNRSKSRDARQARAPENKVTPDKSFQIDSFSDYEGDGAPEAAVRRNSMEEWEDKDWSTVGRAGGDEPQPPASKALAKASSSAPRLQPSQPAQTKRQSPSFATAVESDAKRQADPAKEKAYAQRRSTAQLQLATAVEDRDMTEIREALKEAKDAGVDRKELDNAERVLNFEERDEDFEHLIKNQLDGLNKQLKAVEARFEQQIAGRLGTGPQATWMDSMTRELENRVLHRLEQRMEQVIESAVKRATQELLGAATQVNRLRTGASPHAGAYCGASDSHLGLVRCVVGTALRGAAYRLGLGGGMDYWQGYDQLQQFQQPMAMAGVYGEASRRWRRAARRALLTRRAASALSRGAAFSARDAVGALEADLAEEDEFEALMNRGFKRLSTVTPSVAGLALPKEVELQDFSSRYDKSKILQVSPPSSSTQLLKHVVRSSFAEPAEEKPRDNQAAVRYSVALALKHAGKHADEKVRAEARAAVTLAMQGVARRLKEIALEQDEKARKMQAAFRRRQQSQRSLGQGRKGPAPAPARAASAAEDEKAAKIQAAYRGRQCRQQAARQREQAVKIQAAYRGFASRKGGQSRSQVSHDYGEGADEQAAKIQAAFRGRSCRQREAKKRTAVKTLQMAVRCWLDNRALPGWSLHIVIRAMRRRHRVWADIFEDEAGDEQRSFLDVAGFSAALSRAHPLITPEQIEVLWANFEESQQSETAVMSAKMFCDIAQAVAEGDKAAAEFADKPVEEYAALGFKGPRHEESIDSDLCEIQESRRRMEEALARAEQKVNDASSKIQAVHRGKQARLNLGLQETAAQNIQRAWRRKHGPAPVAALPEQWVSCFQKAVQNSPTQSMLEDTFIAALAEAHPRLSKAQMQAMWRGYLESSDTPLASPLDVQTFCMVCEAVSNGDLAASEFADVSADDFIALGSREGGEDSATAPTEGMEEAAGTIQAFHRQQKQKEADKLLFSKAAAGGTEPLDQGRLYAALSELRPKPTQAQSNYLWRGLTDATGTAGVELEDFLELAQAVRSGSHAAAEFAQIPEGMFISLGDVEAPRAATHIQAVQRARQKQKAYKECQKAARRVQAGWRRCMASRKEGNSVWQAATAIAHRCEVWSKHYDTEAGDQKGLHDGAFVAAFVKAHAQISAKQALAIWQAFRESSDMPLMDRSTFCQLAQAVACGDHAAADCADLPVEKYRALAKEPFSQGDIREFYILLDRSTGMRLGMDANIKDHHTLYINAIKEGGLLSLWNEQNPDTQVVAHDRVVAINDLRGDSHELANECKKNQELRMMIRRNLRES